MAGLPAGVSSRAERIFEKHYSLRQPARFKNLYTVFDRLAAYVDALEMGVQLSLDYMALAEIVRSYFYDVIRYKEYHFDPEMLSPEGEINPQVREKLESLGKDSLEAIDPLSKEWTELVHETVNINASKVASYTAKWILRYKPITVISNQSDVENFSQSDVADAFKNQSMFLADINEHFALQCVLIATNVALSDVSKEKQRDLIYNFKFRSFDESAYFMILNKDYLTSK